MKWNKNASSQKGRVFRSGLLSTSMLAAVLVLAVLWAVVIRGFRFRFSGAVCVPLLFISLYPFVWYAVIRNHSMVHYWMTHRNLAVTFFCLTCMVGLSLQKPFGGKQYG